MDPTQEWAGKEKSWTLRRYPHPGKFEGELLVSKFVYGLTLDGGCEEVGDVQDFGWFGLVDAPLTADNMPEDFTPDELDFLRTMAGAIVYEDSQGFVDVTYYETADELTAEWARIEADAEEFYAEADGETDAEEAATDA